MSNPDPFASGSSWTRYLRAQLSECFEDEESVRIDEGANGMWLLGYGTLHVGVLRLMVQLQWLERKQVGDRLLCSLTRHGRRALEGLRA